MWNKNFVFITVFMCKKCCSDEIKKIALYINLWINLSSTKIHVCTFTKIQCMTFSFFLELDITSCPNSFRPFTMLKFIISLNTILTFGMMLQKQHWNCSMPCREEQFTCGKQFYSEQSTTVSFSLVCCGGFKTLLQVLFWLSFRRAIRSKTTS